MDDEVSVVIPFLIASILMMLFPLYQDALFSALDELMPHITPTKLFSGF